MVEEHLSVADSTYRQQLALEAAKLWRGESDSLQHIGDSETHVYSFIASEKRRFLRLTSSHHRPLSQIEAELDFIRYLHQGGVSVSLPLRSLNGLAVEKMQGANHNFLACVFEEAEGKPFAFNSHGANMKHFRLRGQTLGRIHALAKKYAPSANSRRFAWDEDDCILDAENYLPQSESVVWAEYHRLMDWLRKLPKDEQSFGLIHGDFGATNYRCQDDRLTVFDFDDCCYHWFAYDLAITIYPHGRRKDIRVLLDSLLEGYSEENVWDARLTKDLMSFCRLRLLYMFLTYAKNWGFSNLSEQQSSWFAQKRENMAGGYKLSGL
jgi:Ser/Thr protein kinase RdoA (MazF antagonist)